MAFIELTGEALAGSFGILLRSQLATLAAAEVSVFEILNVMADATAVIIAGIKPAEARESVLKQVMQNLPHLVNTKEQQLRTTTGGVIRPH